MFLLLSVDTYISSSFGLPSKASESILLSLPSLKSLKEVKEENHQTHPAVLHVFIFSHNYIHAYNVLLNFHFTLMHLDVYLPKG